MIQAFVDKYLQQKPTFLQGVQSKFPNTYTEIVKRVVEALSFDEDEYCGRAIPDPERIVCVDHGDYQGTQVFIIAKKGYQPSTYWATCTRYGSCSGCDTLQDIESRLEHDKDDYKKVTVPDACAEDVWTLGLHLVQHLCLITPDNSL